MPSSPSKDAAALTVIGGPGAAIEVLDSEFKVVGSGFNQLTLSLDDGAYVVRLSVAGEAWDKHVRLFPGRTETVLADQLTAYTEVLSREAKAALQLETPGSGLKGVEPSAWRASSHDQDIAVFVRAADDKARADISSSVRLFDAEAQKLRSTMDREAARHVDTKTGWALRQYAAAPGGYVLRYRSVSQRRLEQAVHAFPGRRTFVLLDYGAAPNFEKAGDGYRQRQRWGVDPARTIMVSGDRSTLAPDPADVELAEILLYAFTRPIDRFDLSVVDEAQRSSCPFVRLYALAALANFVVASRSTESLAERLAIFLNGRETDTLLTVLSDLYPPRDWPSDLVAACLHLGKATRDPVDVMPILLSSWDWLVRASVDQPALLPKTRVTRNAGEAREGAGPWLAWRAFPSKTTDGPVADVSHALAELKALELGELTERLQEELQGQSERVDPLTEQRIKGISPGSVANAAVVAVAVSLLMRDGRLDAKALAGLLGAPSWMLEDRLRDVLAEREQDVA